MSLRTRLAAPSRVWMEALREVFDRHLIGADDAREGRVMPVFPGEPVLGHYRSIGDPIGLGLRVMRERGDMARVPLLFHELYMMQSPAAYRRVLVENFGNYDRGVSHTILRSFTGDGLLTAVNEAWVPMRRRVASSFTSKRAATSTALVEKHAERWFAIWDRAAAQGEVRALALDFMALAAQVTWDDYYGAALPRARAEQYVRDFVHVQTDLFGRLENPLRPPSAGALLASARLRKLGRELAAIDPDDPMSAQALTMVATAPENPSNTFGWAALLLGQQPSWADALAESSDDRLQNQVLCESMRLYPGAWGFERVARDDDVIEGFAIPKGVFVALNTYSLHRNPRYWEDPDAFRPERFATRSPRDMGFKYMPFGAGPRRCIGERFALGMVTTVLKRFVQRYRIVLDAAERGEHVALFTLRSKTGVLARLERREMRVAGDGA